MYYSYFYLIYLDPQPAHKCGYFTPTCWPFQDAFNDYSTLMYFECRGADIRDLIHLSQNLEEIMFSFSLKLEDFPANDRFNQS
jgi:hypothetical protein